MLARLVDGSCTEVRALETVICNFADRGQSVEKEPNHHPGLAAKQKLEQAPPAIDSSSRKLPRVRRVSSSSLYNSGYVCRTSALHLKRLKLELWRDESSVPFLRAEVRRVTADVMVYDDSSGSLDLQVHTQFHCRML